jgi:hypothetical protein
MRTWVYKGNRKADAYLYIRDQDDFDLVPDSLLELLGELKLVVNFELDGERKLAQADSGSVLKQLERVGYFLQLPPVETNSQKPC